MPDYSIMRPDSRIFEKPKTSVAQKMQEREVAFIIERVEYPEEGGSNTYYQGIPFCRHGQPFVEAIIAADAVKRTFMDYVRLATSKPFLPLGALFALMPWKWKLSTIERFLEAFCNNADYIFDHCYIEMVEDPQTGEKHPEWRTCYLQFGRYVAATRELWNLIGLSLFKLGISQTVADHFGKVFATKIEFDDYYKYVIQDLFNEINKEALLADPRKELKRIAALCLERIWDSKMEWPVVANKFKAVFWLLDILLRSKKIKEAFLWAVQHERVNIDNIKPDKNDRYWMLKWKTYKFFGLNDTQKIFEINKIHYGQPPPHVVIGG